METPGPSTAMPGGDSQKLDCVQIPGSFSTVTQTLSTGNPRSPSPHTSSAHDESTDKSANKTAGHHTTTTSEQPPTWQTGLGSGTKIYQGNSHIQGHEPQNQGIDAWAEKTTQKTNNIATLPNHTTNSSTSIQPAVNDKPAGLRKKEMAAEPTTAVSGGAKDSGISSSPDQTDNSSNVRGVNSDAKTDTPPVPLEKKDRVPSRKPPLASDTSPKSQNHSLKKPTPETQDSPHKHSGKLDLKNKLKRFFSMKRTSQRPKSYAGQSVSGSPQKKPRPFSQAPPASSEAKINKDSNPRAPVSDQTKDAPTQSAGSTENNKRESGFIIPGVRRKSLLSENGKSGAKSGTYLGDLGGQKLVQNGDTTDSNTTSKEATNGALKSTATYPESFAKSGMTDLKPPESKEASSNDPGVTKAAGSDKPSSSNVDSKRPCPESQVNAESTEHTTVSDKSSTNAHQTDSHSDKRSSQPPPEPRVALDQIAQESEASAFAASVLGAAGFADATASHGNMFGLRSNFQETGGNHSKAESAPTNKQQTWRVNPKLIGGPKYHSAPRNPVRKDQSSGSVQLQSSLGEDLISGSLPHRFGRA